MSPDVSKSFLEDLQQFLTRREDLKARGATTRRGYLLYGEYLSISRLFLPLGLVLV